MGKLLLVLCSIAFIASSTAQNYKPVLDDFNEWQVTTCYSGCLTDVYFTDGDTLVDGNTYKILDGYHFISRTFLLRENIATKKVYLNLVQASGNEEFLLYDFSLAVGDSIAVKNPISPFPTDGGYFKLDSIVNRELVDGNEYKHFYLSPTPTNTISTNPAVWVEGVGSLSLINAPGGFPDINGAGLLTCSFKDGELFYSNSHDGCESIILSNIDHRDPLEQLNLKTLIVNGQSELHHAENVASIDLFDLNGRKLGEITNNGQEHINLDFSRFTAGIYLVVANSTAQEKKVFKVIVK